ncbi:MAG: ERG2 family protein [Deltaproteobacteria bacterium]|nr:ERG2 family protein [Deltaproteobacteria bacterium]
MKKLAAVVLALTLLAVVGCETHEPEAVGGATFAAQELNAMLDQESAPGRGGLVRAWRELRKAAPYDETDGDYLFDPVDLQQIAQLGVGLPVAQAWDVIHAELMRRYPGKIAENYRWTFNSAGTAFCQIAIVYASTKEYVAFFGTPIGAEGFSGRYNADVWDLMVDGEMWTYVPGQFDRTVYTAGDLAYLPRDGGKGVRYVDHAWMIDYGRGDIISMFPFGVIAPALFVTLDYQSAWEQFADYGKLVVKTF